MTNLELVEHDLTPCGSGKDITRIVVAMSCSHRALTDYCKETYDTEIGHQNVNEKEKYYTIHNSKMVIVPERKD